EALAELFAGDGLAVFAFEGFELPEIQTQAANGGVWNQIRSEMLHSIGITALAALEGKLREARQGRQGAKSAKENSFVLSSWRSLRPWRLGAEERTSNAELATANWTTHNWQLAVFLTPFLPSATVRSSPKVLPPVQLSQGK